MAENTDFNDLAAGAGLPAVKEAVKKAIAAEHGTPYGAFTVKKDGVYYTATPRNGEPEEIFFCSRLAPLGIARTGDGNHFALVLQLTDFDNRIKTWIISLELIQRAGGEEARAQFSRLGGAFGPGIRAKALFSDYLNSILRSARRNLPRVTLADRCGWIESGKHYAFVLPGETIGTLGKEEVILTGTGEELPDYSTAGTVSDWQNLIGCYCVQNSRLILAVSLPLAAPLLFHIGGEGGGFNFVGSSSIGKTTLHHVAASVAGAPGDFIKTCNSTSNAFEAVAALHNDAVLLLDELGEASAESIGGTVYKLAGGIGRGRADQHGNARARQQWRILFATTGETDLATMTKSTGKRTFVGQELRMCDIPADAGQGQGVFEEIHDFKTSAEFADSLRASAGRVYGALLREYLRRLVAEMNEPHQRTARLKWMHESRQSFIKSAVPPSASGQITRAAGRFALVAAGGELASEYGLTGWQSGTATAAAMTCFNAWLSRRGSLGQGEVEQLLRQVAAFFETHGEGRFTNMSSEKPRPTPNRAGFDSTWAARVLVDQGLLQAGSDGKPQAPHRLPGMGLRRCYHFPAQITPEE